MKKSILVFTALLVGLCDCYGQRRFIAHAILNGRPQADTLIDKTTLTKFILDTTRIYVTAIDKNGKQLWKTDAWKDGGLPEYRVKRPVIVEFTFGQYSPDKNSLDRRTRRKAKRSEFIFLTYNNTQLGILEKGIGEFQFLRQL